MTNPLDSMPNLNVNPPPPPPVPLRPLTLLLFALPLVVAVGFVTLLVLNPGTFFTSVRQWVQRDGVWVELPRLGEPAYHFEVAPDGAVWALNGSGVHRYDGAAWQRVYDPAAHPTDFTIDGGDLWLMTHDAIVRCDTAALTCAVEQALSEGRDVAALNGKVYGVTADARLWWRENGAWDSGRLASLLPTDRLPQETLSDLTFTDDGTLWLRWGSLWRFNGVFWEAAEFGGADTTGVKLTGTSPGLLWTEWRSGLIAVQPDQRDWTLYTWEQMKAPGYDWIFDLRAAPNGSVWIAGKTGLIHYDGGEWDLLPLPDNPLVTALALTPDGALWVQTTDSGTETWLVPIVVLFGSLLLLRWSGSRIARAWGTRR